MPRLRVMDSSRQTTRAMTIGGFLIVMTSPALAQPARNVNSQSSQHHHGAAAATVELFPAREASGTAWSPDETPMYGVHKALGAWHVMFHGSAFGQLLYEPGERHRTGGFSSRQVSGVNWLMVMARRPAGGARVGLKAMASAEPWTVRNCGFINLLASGEWCQGDTIHDRQHPHDLIMELAADYDRPVRDSLRWHIYAGLAGEPALGPPAFPHRVSALSNPVAPIAHHWLDSSHITFGLITTGLSGPRWRAEGSLFNGREPDEDRADLDLGPLDSVSGRVTVMPTNRLAIQVSAAHLRDAEEEFPQEPRNDLERVTASGTYHRPLGPTGIWATTLAYGMNAGKEVIPGDVVNLVTHGVLLESNVSIGNRHTWFARLEAVGKPGHDLHAHEAPATIFLVGKAQGGYVRYFAQRKGVVMGVGGTASVSLVPAALESRYSGRAAPGFGVFVTVRPARHGG